MTVPNVDLLDCPLEQSFLVTSIDNPFDLLSNSGSGESCSSTAEGRDLLANDIIIDHAKERLYVRYLSAVLI